MLEKISEILVPEYAIKEIAEQIVKEVKQGEEEGKVIEIIEQFLSEDEHIHIVPMN